MSKLGILSILLLLYSKFCDSKIWISPPNAKVYKPTQHTQLDALHLTNNKNDVVHHQQQGELSARMVGQVEAVSVDDPDVLLAAEFARSILDARSDSPTILGIYKILSATKQVVAGISYQITMQLAQTYCPRYSTSTTCPINYATANWDDPYFDECSFTATKGLSTGYELKNIECKNKDSTRQILLDNRESSQDKVNTLHQEDPSGHNQLFHSNIIPTQDKYIVDLEDPDMLITADFRLKNIN